MNETDAGLLLRETMLVAVKLAGPALLVALVVGLVTSLLQAVTQINEQTLAFLPKAAAIGGALLLLAPFIEATLRDFGTLVFARLAEIGAS